jgi:hypothetical protein
LDVKALIMSGQIGGAMEDNKDELALSGASPMSIWI